MSMSVEQFKNRLTGGGARNNLFKVIITDFGINDVETISWLCRAASLPGSTVAEIAVPFRGRDIYVAGDRTFEPWPVTVYNDIDNSQKANIEGWMHSYLNKHEENTSDQHPATYKRNMMVMQLDKAGNPVPGLSYTFIGAFPTAVGQIDLTFSSAGEVEEFEVTFRYDYWISDRTPSPAPAQILQPVI